MSQVQLFNHPELGSLTTYVDDSGKEYYKVNDVCISLRLSNPSQQIKRHVKEKWVFKFDDGYSKSGEALYVSEPGLYALIFRSSTPQAEKFQDWVFEEVLPKLRASGYYIASTATSEQLEAAREEIDQLQLVNTKVMKMLVEKTKDKSELYDLYYSLGGAYLCGGERRAITKWIYNKCHCEFSLENISKAVDEMYPDKRRKELTLSKVTNWC